MSRVEDTPAEHEGVLGKLARRIGRITSRRIKHACGGALTATALRCKLPAS
jgi:hypothetical protein